MKSVDFDARANELANRFKANTLKTLKGRGLSGKGAIAQLYGARADSYTGEALSKDKNLNNPNHSSTKGLY